MQMQNIIRAGLFIFFFSIGAASLSSSILCNDLIQYYRNKQLLKAAHRSLNRLESLNAEYDALLRQFEQDPNLVKRIAAATLGTAPEDPNAVYPTPAADQLAAAEKALTEKTNAQSTDSGTPEWLTRCCKPYHRLTLLSAGAALILISFVCFSPAKQTGQRRP
jgi:hypothetical protein